MSSPIENVLEAVGAPFSVRSGSSSNTKANDSARRGGADEQVPAFDLSLFGGSDSGSASNFAKKGKNGRRSPSVTTVPPTQSPGGPSLHNENEYSSSLLFEFEKDGVSKSPRPPNSSAQTATPGPASVAQRSNPAAGSTNMSLSNWPGIFDIKLSSTSTPPLTVNNTPHNGAASFPPNGGFSAAAFSISGSAEGHSPKASATKAPLEDPPQPAAPLMVSRSDNYYFDDSGLLESHNANSSKASPLAPLGRMNFPAVTNGGAAGSNTGGGSLRRQIAPIKAGKQQGMSEAPRKNSVSTSSNNHRQNSLNNSPDFTFLSTALTDTASNRADDRSGASDGARTDSKANSARLPKSSPRMTTAATNSVPTYDLEFVRAAGGENHMADRQHRLSEPRNASARSAQSIDGANSSTHSLSEQRLGGGQSPSQNMSGGALFNTTAVDDASNGGGNSNGIASALSFPRRVGDFATDKFAATCQDGSRRTSGAAAVSAPSAGADDRSDDTSSNISAPILRRPFANSFTAGGTRYPGPRDSRYGSTASGEAGKGNDDDERGSTQSYSQEQGMMHNFLDDLRGGRGGTPGGVEARAKASDSEETKTQQNDEITSPITTGPLSPPNDNINGNTNTAPPSGITSPTSTTGDDAAPSSSSATKQQNQQQSSGGSGGSGRMKRADTKSRQKSKKATEQEHAMRLLLEDSNTTPQVSPSRTRVKGNGDSAKVPATSPVASPEVSDVVVSGAAGGGTGGGGGSTIAVAKQSTGDKSSLPASPEPEITSNDKSASAQESAIGTPAKAHISSGMSDVASVALAPAASNVGGKADASRPTSRLSASSFYTALTPKSIIVPVRKRLWDPQHACAALCERNRKRREDRRVRHLPDNKPQADWTAPETYYYDDPEYVAINRPGTPHYNHHFFLDDDDDAQSLAGLVAAYKAERADNNSSAHGSISNEYDLGGDASDAKLKSEHKFLVLDEADKTKLERKSSTGSISGAANRSNGSLTVKNSPAPASSGEFPKMKVPGGPARPGSAQSQRVSGTASPCGNFAPQSVTFAADTVFYPNW